jgi:hypothetical protein
MESSALNALIFISAILIVAALMAKALRGRFPRAGNICYFLGGIGAYYGALRLSLPMAQPGLSGLGTGLALFLALGLGANPFRAGLARFSRRSLLSALASLAAGLALSAALELLYGGGSAAFSQRALLLAAVLLLANPQSLIESLLALGSTHRAVAGPHATVGAFGLSASRCWLCPSWPGYGIVPAPCG